MSRMREKYVLGLTGGVGAGKSTVLQFLKEEFGACILQADTIAREQMEPGGPAYEAVTAAFGEEILAQDGTVDRAALSEIVYASEERRLLLNALTHPLVRQEAERRIAEAKEELVVYEAALPEEAQLRELCQEVWFVHAPQEVRIRRLTASRGYSQERCRQMMASQLSDEEFTALSDRVIENGGSPEETRRQLRRLLPARMREGHRNPEAAP